MKKLIYGVGINDADYTVDTNSGGKRKKCKAYTAWTSMLCRCYSDKYQQQFPSYKGCSVCDEWRLFSNFKKWFYAQPGNETYVLDKDLLVAENKIYSPETCLLIPVKVNSFLTERNAGRGKYPIGVHKRTGKEIFIATCGSD